MVEGSVGRSVRKVVKLVVKLVGRKVALDRVRENLQIDISTCLLFCSHSLFCLCWLDGFS